MRYINVLLTYLLTYLLTKLEGQRLVRDTCFYHFCHHI